jgi:hypothetical protein
MVRMTQVYYAGIGSRDTPLAVARQMENIAMLLALRGFTLRSGMAKRRYNAPDDTDSADLAFERGCTSVNGRKVIRVHTYDPAALAHAEQFHPAWNACSDFAKQLHARNSLIMLGDALDESVSFVVCWTPQGAVTGGTGQALRIAAHHNIPVFNLAEPDAEARLWAWLASAQ